MKGNFFLKKSSTEKIKDILIIGLGKSGLSCIRYLSKQEGYKKKSLRISVYDKNKSIEDQKDLLKNFDIEDFFTSNIKYEFLDRKSHIFLSPGVSSLEIKKFKTLPNIINDLSLFLEYLAKDDNNLKIIGVTGTNGKTTTCLFLEHLFTKAGYKAKVAGNVGQSPLDLIDEIQNLDVIILEISSFQLNPFKENGFPGKKMDVGIFLNFTEDHLDMHESMEDYLQSKIALLKSCERQINNSQVLKKIPIKFKDITFKYSNSNHKEIKDLEKFTGENYIVKTLKHNKIIINCNDLEVDIDTTKLSGEHNALNFTAAIAAFRCLDKNFKAFKNVINSFKGAPHRIEWVRELNNIEFYNDSKATNVASTVAALEVFKEKNVLLIVGGDRKKLSLTPLKKYLTKNVSHLLLIGKDSLEIKKLFENIEKLNIFVCKGLASAVNMAWNHSKSGDIILLSPSCSSQDIYKNYIERGEHFKKIVHALK